VWLILLTLAYFRFVRPQPESEPELVHQPS
jgi:histidine transporter